MRLIFICGPSGCAVFSTLSRKRHDFEKNPLFDVILYFVILYNCYGDRGSCARNRKVADSIPDGVTGIFH